MMAANTSVSVDNEVPIQRDKFVCIEYPGRVENVDRMLETLGDEESISKTIAETNKRIELRFRPDDPYCKPVCGNLYQTNNLLVRVKRRYRKPKPSHAGKEGTVSEEQAVDSGAGDGKEPPEDVQQDVTYKSEVLGVVESTYRFTGMCDFQYLPMHKNKDGQMESLIEKIIPSNLEGTNYFDQEMPYHLQPPSFSRTDIPTDYYYKPDQIQHRPSYPQVAAETLESNLIGRNRARRPHNTYIIQYDRAASIPVEPHPNALKAIERYKNVEPQIAELKSIFEKRPLWSKNALKSTTNFTHSQYKIFLPMVAYYFTTGPWRALWCRLGYDPRKTADGKEYQMLDFRLRKVMVGVYGKGVIKAKRSTYVYRLPITIRRPTPQAVTVGQRSEEQEEQAVPKEAYYIFRRGLVPAYHQMFYQLCDLQVDELQALVHRNDGRETTCDERNGWLEPDVLGKLRDLITDILKETLISIRKEVESSQNTEDQPSTSQLTEDKAGAGDDNDVDDDDDDDDDEDDALGQDEGDEDDNDEQDDDDINEMEMEMLEYIDTEDT